jgi:hypothetical protein
MGYSVNKISSADSVFLASGAPTDRWRGELSTLVNAPTISKWDDGSIAVTGDNQAEFRVVFNKVEATGKQQSSFSVTTDEMKDDYVESFVWIKSDNIVTVSSKMQLIAITNATLLPEETITSTFSNTRITTGEWTLVRSGVVQVPSDEHHYGISLTITFKNVSGVDTTPTVYISNPTAYSRLQFTNNPSFFSVYETLPQVLQLSDSEVNAPTYSLLRFVETSLAMRGELYDLYQDIIPLDISQGYSPTDLTTHSALVDGDKIFPEFAPFIAQFVGTKLSNPSPSSTPWENIPATWEEIDGVDIALEANSPEDAVEWRSLERYNTQISGLADFFRWQISTGYYGLNAGSKSALVSAAKYYCTGTKTVNYSVPSVWNVKIETKLEETPNGGSLVVGDSNPDILDFLEKIRPLGTVFEHELIA